MTDLLKLSTDRKTAATGPRWEAGQKQWAAMPNPYGKESDGLDCPTGQRL